MTLAENIPVLGPIIGGLLIGTATVMLLLLNGNIAGISGILGRSMKRDFGLGGWRLAFLLGLVLAIPAYQLWHDSAPAYTLDANLPLLLVAGLFVGVGTRVGSGCTSGHGVCGISNLSPRSLLATVIFMASAALVVYFRRHGVA